MHIFTYWRDERLDREIDASGLALQKGKFSFGMIATVENETDPQTLSTTETNSLSLLTA